VEQDNQILTLCCIVAVHPDIADKSYLNILENAYQLWGDEVMSTIREANDQDEDLHVGEEFLNALNRLKT
jgi:hypothetical protein